MKCYFEYRNYRGHTTGYSVDVEWTDYKDMSRRAYGLIERINEIWTVIAHNAANHEELCRWRK